MDRAALSGVFLSKRSLTVSMMIHGSTDFLIQTKKEINQNPENRLKTGK
jgi:hypothetical protein